MPISLLVLDVLGHSWLDCIGYDVEYNGPVQFYSHHFYDEYCIGYPRGYPGRYNPDINSLYTVLIEGRHHNRLKPSDRVCGRVTQGPGNYSHQFPMTKVHAGSRIKLWYEMDGHRVPQTQVRLHTFGQPGKLLNTISDQEKASPPIQSDVFANNSVCIDTKKPNTFCWSYFDIPKTWTPGVYSFLWNWVWDLNPIGEEYNTCFDIEIIPGELTELESGQSYDRSSSKHLVAQQQINNPRISVPVDRVFQPKPHVPVDQVFQSKSYVPVDQQQCSEPSKTIRCRNRRHGSYN